MTEPEMKNNGAGIWPLRRSTSDGQLLYRKSAERSFDRGRSLRMSRHLPGRQTRPKIPKVVRIECDKPLPNEPVEEAPPTRSRKSELIILACLCWVDFTTFMASSIKAPFFPKEAAKKGLDAGTTGLVFSFYALAMFICSPFIPRLIPYTGPRFLLIIGLALNGLCSTLFGLLAYVYGKVKFTVLCLVLEGLSAVGATAYSMATYVYIVDIFPTKVGSVTGLTESFVALGMSLGPVLGGFLYHAAGFQASFYALGGFLLLTLPVVLYILPKISDADFHTSPSCLEALKMPSVIVTGIIVTSLASVWSSLDPTLEPHLREFELTPEKVGLTFLLFSFLYGISTPVWGFLSDTTNRNNLMMTIGLFLSTVALLLLGPAPFLTFLPNELWLNLVALSLLGVSMALSLLPTFPSLLLYISNKFGNVHYDVSSCGMVAGLWSSFYTFGEVIGPLVGSLITEHFGFSSFCTVMASATFILGTGCLIYFCVCDPILRCRQGRRYDLRDAYAREPDLYDYASNLRRPILSRRRDQLYTEESAV